MVDLRKRVRGHELSVDGAEPVGDRSYGGRQATAALAASIELDAARPLHADAVIDNLGSIRVFDPAP